MKEITIREATPQDLEILLRFEQEIIKKERPFDPTLEKDPIRYYDIAAMIKSPDATVVVAESNGKTIGSGFARIEKVESYLKHTHHAWLGFMYVAPAYRGKGINRLIIENIKNGLLERA